MIPGFSFFVYSFPLLLLFFNYGIVFAISVELLNRCSLVGGKPRYLYTVNPDIRNLIVIL